MSGKKMEALKAAAAQKAAEWIRDGMRVGLGTGSTVRFLLAEIADRRGRGSWRGIVGVPTSLDTERRAEALGIPLSTLDDQPWLDLTIDGADEIDPRLRLIKGLGGALLREKIVASASETVVVIADESKRVERLGSVAPLPVEVEPFGASIHEAFLESLGAAPQLRRTADGEPFTTDGGNVIYDARFGDGIADPAGVERLLNDRPGILEHGLFLGLADHAVIASESGVNVLSRAD